MNARTLIALLLAAAASGCMVDNTSSVVITNACAPPTPAAGGVCIFPATCSGGVLVGNPWVDTTFAMGLPTDGMLLLPLQIDNQRPDNATVDVGGRTTSTAYVTGYKFKFSSAAVALPSVSVDWSTTTIPPVGSQTALVPVIPASISALLAANPALTAEVKVEVQATGHYGDGTKFETGPFSLVVDVLNGFGVGYGCPAATPTLVAVCPQPGQTGVPLCQ